MLNKPRTRNVVSNNVNLGLSDSELSTSITALNGLLASNFKLLMKVWGFHWNMVGESFHTNHVYFKDLYDELIEDVDSIAERIKSLGGRALGSLSAMISNSTLTEVSESNAVPSIQKMMEILVKDYENIIIDVRNILSKISEKDHGTNNFLEDFIDSREKVAWMLRSHIA